MVQLFAQPTNSAKNANSQGNFGGSDSAKNLQAVASSINAIAQTIASIIA